MSIADDILRVLPELRAQAESLMFDTCTITRGGAPTWDEDSGTFTPGTGTTVYTGRCKVQTENVQVTNPDVAGREAVVVAWFLDLPIDSSVGIRVNDTATITAAALDADLLGKVFTIAGPHVGTIKTARRLPVKAEVSSWA